MIPALKTGIGTTNTVDPLRLLEVVSEPSGHEHRARGVQRSC